jgi:hypothetical protein
LGLHRPLPYSLRGSAAASRGRRRQSNQIDLNIYVHLPRQPPVLRADVPADSKVATGITCGNLEMTAKDPAGSVIARRGPFPTRDESDWVISMTAPRVLRHEDVRADHTRSSQDSRVADTLRPDLTSRNPTP